MNNGTSNLPATLDPVTLKHVIVESGVEVSADRMLSPEDETAVREELRARMQPFDVEGYLLRRGRGTQKT